ncbi:MAG: cytochrome c, partial [Paracoccaceae bacterium]
MKTILMASCAALLLTGTAMAQGDIVQTRVATMKSIGAGLGTLGGMIRGRSDYDSATAQSAADAILAAVTSADAETLFPVDTDEMSVDGTRA